MMVKNILAQIYEITFIPDGRRYTGITWGNKGTYEVRFRKHMEGKGGVHIRELLNQGYTEKDFTIKLLYDKIPLFEARKIEESLSVLYPEGLNGNKGNAIIRTEQGNRQWKEKWDSKKEEIRFKIAYTLSYDKDEDKIRKRMVFKDFKKNHHDEYIKQFHEYKIQHANKCFNSLESIQKRTETIRNLSENKKMEYNQKRSISIKKYLTELTKDELSNRMKNSLGKLTEEQKIIRGQNISKSKKGKKTNQQNIMRERYKLMTDSEFQEWCVGRKDFVVVRAKNLRNG